MVRDLNVVIGAHRKESLEPRAGMFRPLPFHAVWQQHDHATEPLPLVLAAGDELVDDHLSNVDEVAELGFPDHQPVRAIETVTVLKTKAHFRSGLL